MLVIDRVGLEAVGRFVEPQVFEISSLGNLVQVDGENKNTGGSSGSGKSTIFHAIDFLFGLNHIAANKLQSRNTKNPMSVWGEGHLNGQPIKITRNKKGLSIEGAGLDVSGNSKLAEEALDKLIAMPRDLFRKIIHKRQREDGFFLNLTPKETNEFLMDCLNLTHLRTKLDIADSALKDLTKSKEAKDKELLSAKEGLKATQNAILGLGLAPVRDIHPDTVQQLKDKLEASRMAFAKVQNAVNDMILLHKTQSGELDKQKPSPSVLPYNRADLEGYEKQLKDIQSAIQKAGMAELERQNKAKQEVAALNLKKSGLQHQIVTGLSLKKDAESIAAQIKKIRESVCPTCAQTWATDQAKLHEGTLLEQLKKIKPEIERGQAAEIELHNEVEPKLAALLPETLARQVDVKAEKSQEETLIAYISAEKQKERDHNISENSRMQTVLGEFYAKQKALKEAQDREAAVKSVELNNARGQMDIDSRSYDAANYKLHSYETSLVKYEQTAFTLKNQGAKYQAEIESLESNIKDLEKKILFAEEGKRALKTFVSYSFDNALEAIGEEATRIIRNIPNMANATIQLVGSRETAKGAVKEEVTAIIHSDGEEGIPIETFSGGERSALDLAIDLAVIDLIESETGKGMNFFILDEPFTGLGSVEIEMALEVLKNSNMNKKLIIVDHNPEVKQMVHNRVVVIREGATSRLAV